MNKEQVEQLIEENERLRREIALLRQKLNLLARRIFGRKSEQLDSNQLEFLLGKLNEPESSLPASGDAAIPEADAKPRRKNKPRKPRTPDDLPVETEIIDPPSVTENPSLFRKISEEVTEQIDYEPGRFLKRRTVRTTWVKRNDPDAVPVTAVLPPKLLDRGILAPGLLAHILVSKYMDHLPLHRQEAIFDQRHGVYLPRQTLARGVELAADRLKPIVDHILAGQLAGGYVQIDETPVKYLSPGQGRTSQACFWTVKTPHGDTVYRWTPGRGHESLLNILPERFTGTVQCDGYGAYRTMLKKRPDVRLAGCWAHVRRKFHEAFEQKEAPVRSTWVLRQIGQLGGMARRPGGRKRMGSATGRRAEIHAHQRHARVLRLRYDYELNKGSLHHTIQTERRDFDLIWEELSGQSERARWGWLLGARYITLDERFRIVENKKRLDDTGSVEWFLAQAGYWGGIQPFYRKFMNIYGGTRIFLGEAEGIARSGSDKAIDGKIEQKYIDEYSLAYGWDFTVGLSLRIREVVGVHAEYFRHYLYSFESTDSGIVVFPDNSDALFIDEVHGVHLYLSVLW